MRVLRLPDLPLDPEIAARFHPVEAARAGEDGRLPLYQMGNNSYHAAVWELAMERPGVLVLHDLVLHHFLLDRTVGKGEFEPYREALERDHGWIGDAAARPVRWGAFGRAAQFFLPANRTLLRRQRGVLVHGQWAASVLREEDPELAVRVVSMGIPLPPPARRDVGLAFRAAVAHSARGAAPRLVRLPDADQAHRRGDPRPRFVPASKSVHLLIAGELSPYSNYAALAAELGVAERVHVTGFLPFDQLDAAISATDLCLNLRYPTAGETSASLLRILAVGRPVVVSDYADFGDLPEEIALHIPPGEGEMEKLARGAGAAARRPGRRSIGWARRRGASSPSTMLPNAPRMSWSLPSPSSQSSSRSPNARRSRVRAARRCRGACRAGSSCTAARTGRPASVASSRSTS